MGEKENKYMDDEERNLIESIEKTPKDQFKPAEPDLTKEIQRAAKAHQRNRETKMNIRIDRHELERIKRQAEQEGLRYQTFVKSVLHKYLTGQLVDSTKRAG